MFLATIFMSECEIGFEQRQSSKHDEEIWLEIHMEFIVTHTQKNQHFISLNLCYLTTFNVVNIV